MRTALIKMIHGAATLGLAALIAGCATEGPKPTATINDFTRLEAGQNQQISQRNETHLAAVRSNPLPAQAEVGEGDLLNVNIFEAPELQSDARVDNKGFITLPLVGTVSVLGLTVPQAEKKISETYSRKYLRNAHAKVFIKEHQSGKVTLLGAVAKPGTYDLLARQRLMDVLAMAGGVSDKATPGVEVRRRGNDPVTPTVFFIDMDDISKRGRADLNIEIQRGDVIVVPEASIVYVDGAVRNSGVFTIRRNMSVQEAITAAGGLSPTADPKRIKVVRNVADGKKEVIEVSMNDVTDSKSSFDLRVRDQDTVFVETNGMKAFFYGLRLTGPFGGGAGYSPAPR